MEKIRRGRSRGRVERGGQWSQNLALNFFLHLVHPEPPSCLWGRGHDFCHLGHRGPGCLAPGTSFMEDNFLTDGWGVALGLFKHITCVVHFISIIIISVPAQIIRH